MSFVQSYIAALKGIALNEPIFVKDLCPTIQVQQIHEPTTADRYNSYATYMRLKRKTSAAGG